MIGYRAWNLIVQLRAEELKFRLSSLMDPRVIWERDMAAVCSEPGNPVQEHLRNMEHTCGIYSLKDPSSLEPRDIEPEEYSDIIYGTIFNYGVVGVYSEGYRSSHAMIDSLFDIPFRCSYPPREKADYFLLAEDIPTPFLVCSKHREAAIEFWRPEYLTMPGWPLKRVVVLPVEAIYRELSIYYQAPIVKLLGGIGQTLW